MPNESTKLDATQRRNSRRDAAPVVAGGSLRRKLENKRSPRTCPVPDAVRVCLRCDNPFPSTGPGNRICPDCDRKGESISGCEQQRHSVDFHAKLSAARAITSTRRGD